MAVNEIGGYKVVGLKFDEGSSPHYIYLKRHSIREKCLEKPSDRTLFILGVPPYCTEESFKTLFSRFWPVENVFFHSNPTSSAPPVEKSTFFPTVPKIVGFKVAYVVFSSPSGVDTVMDLKSDTALVLSTKDNRVETGLTKFVLEYNKRIPNVEEMTTEINTFMKEYDKREEERIQNEKALADPDNDGWMTIGKRGRMPGIARKETVDKNIKTKERKKRTKKELLNFYRFQIKESKMKQLITLRNKFEEDKKKIELLKQARKFKPFK